MDSIKTELGEKTAMGDLRLTIRLEKG